MSFVLLMWRFFKLSPQNTLHNFKYNYIFYFMIHENCNKSIYRTSGIWKCRVIYLIETGVEYVKLGYSVQSLINIFYLSFIKNLCSSNYNFKKCTVFKMCSYLDVKTTYIHVCVQIHKSHHKKRRNTYPLFPLAASQQNF